MRTIDTFDIAKQAQQVGFNTEQTEFFVNTVNIIEDTHISNLATKNDLLLVEERLNGKIDATKSELNSRIDRLDNKINAVKNDITVRVGVMIGIAIAIITWLDKVVQ